MAVLGYLAKLKSSLGLAFGAHFLHVFFHESFPCLILYQWSSFNVTTYFFLKILNKMCY